MAEHGGYRKPEHPAPTSGPGALSRRTDGSPATTQPPMVADGGAYGSRKAMEDLQGSAPLQGGGGSTPAPAPAPVPFDAPTTNPAEPVTAGAPVGPGIGPQAAGIMDDQQMTLQQLHPMLNSLEVVANLPSATPETAAYLRALKARLAAQPDAGPAGV